MEPGFSGSHNHGKSKTGKKKNFKCFKCGKPGHFRNDCRGLNTSYSQKNVASTSEDGNALCCEAAVANENRKRFADVWLFDTGATFHITVRREWFHQYKPISGGGSVCSCNDHELKIIEIGIIIVKMHDGTIRDVRHVKGLKTNLLSLGQLDDLGCKQHHLKFKTSNFRSVYVLELVYSDVWQAPILSLGGAKYFVSFIDDYSRRCWVYPIKKKSDVFEVFKVYKARVELDSGKKIKCLRTDNGGEYTGDEFDTFCRQEGIKRQFTTAYTPQQNGVAERMNKTLLERARAMLATASLGKSFWAEADNTACYVINRSPSTTVELKTPMEMWTGKPVDYSDLHIFGSPVYVMYNTQETTKLDPKSRKCLFLGYADGVKGYRLWDPTAHKVVVSRDVVFMEDKVQENEEGDSTTRETATIQMEKEFQSNDSSEAVPQHEVNETTESQALTTRTSDRERRRPGWKSYYVIKSNVAYCLLTEEGEPSTLQEALNNPDASFWKEAMQEEIEALHKNKTWELVPLPGGGEVSCKTGGQMICSERRNRLQRDIVPCGSNDNCSGGSGIVCYVNVATICNSIAGFTLANTKGKSGTRGTEVVDEVEFPTDSSSLPFHPCSRNS
ncbi:gag-pol polyprotein [Tanacetum coccineum]